MSIEFLVGHTKKCDENRMNSYVVNFGMVFCQLSEKQLICEDCPNYLRMRTDYCRVLK